MPIAEKTVPQPSPNGEPTADDYLRFTFELLDADVELSLYDESGNNHPHGIGVHIYSESGRIFDWYSLEDLIDRLFVFEESCATGMLTPIDETFEREHPGFHDRRLQMWKNYVLLVRLRNTIREWKSDVDVLTFEQALSPSLGPASNT